MPRSLRARLLIAFLVVGAAALATVGVAVLLTGPGYFAEAMGYVSTPTFRRDRLLAGNAAA